MSIKERWNRACAETIGSDLFWQIAVDHLSIWKQLAPLIDRYGRGVILDAGAGQLAWRALLERNAASYIATDYVPVHRDLAFCADLQGGLPLPDRSVDTIFCCSVLEHAPEPWRVLPEFCRVLKPGGHIILSVPFLYYLHGAPHDYFRFTVHGVTRLAETAGLKIVEQSIGGGIIHSILQSLSMHLAALLWTPRAPSLVTIPVRGMLAAAKLFDRMDRGHLFAQTVNVVLRHG